MSKRSRRHRDLHDGVKGYAAAEGLVRSVARQWEAGLPLRRARKILRKQGIHSWSLLVFLEGEAWIRMLLALDAPGWLVTAGQDASRGFMNGGFAFHHGEGPLRLPEGLVLPRLDVAHWPGLVRLPRRLWTPWVSLRDCPRLENLPEGPAFVEIFHMTRCPRVKEVSDVFSRAGLVELVNCAALKTLPVLDSHPPRISTVFLCHLPSLEELSGWATIQGLKVWKCRSLKQLHRTTVSSWVKIHGCPVLESMPMIEVSCSDLEVTDCPSLLNGWACIPTGSFRFDPVAGPSGPPPPQPIPGIQPAEEFPLLPGESAGSDPAWPWPPGPPWASPVDSSLRHVLGAVGLSSQDQLLALLGAGGEPNAIIKGLLRAARDPGEAVALAHGWLKEAADRNDRRLAELILLHIESLGLGSLSPLLRLSGEQVLTVAKGIHDSHPKAFDGYVHTGQFLSTLGRVSGPLVILEPALHWVERMGIRELEGPLWVKGDLTIQDCPDLEVLPDLLVVQENLEIVGCESLRRFPRRLEVGGTLVLQDLPRLHAQFCRAKVGGFTFLQGVPGLHLVPLDTP